MGVDTTNDNSVYKLSSEEIENPYLVIEKLFDFARLPEVREMLWESFKANITGSYPKKLSWSERNEIVCLYEYLEKLVEVSHLLLKIKSSKELPHPLL